MKRQEFDGGVWWIEDGELGLDIAKLLERFGLEDTQENRDLAVQIALEEAREHMPDVPIVVVERL